MRRRLALLFMFVLAGRWNVTAPAADLWWPGPDYPLPERAAAPAWLLTQKLNFSRWDGGPLEVCKGMLSGWPYRYDENVGASPYRRSTMTDRPRWQVLHRRLYTPNGKPLRQSGSNH